MSSLNRVQADTLRIIVPQPEIRGGREREVRRGAAAVGAAGKRANAVRAVAGPESARSAVAEDGRDALTANGAGYPAGVIALRGL
ncbi:MAG: hypothetical protein IT175_04805 [Acidobacteria bacterium]|nr:hypothetical protein [Acidobacteriota bacterium]